MAVTNDQFAIKTDIVKHRECNYFDNWTVTITDIISGKNISICDMFNFASLMDDLSVVYNKMKAEQEGK